VVWENLDGQPHDFTIQNSDGTNLQQSDQTSEEGATASLTFTATPQMSQSVCTIHPNTMVGDVEVSNGDAPDPDEETGIPLWSVLMLSAVVLAFISPVLFAVFLFSRGSDAAETVRR
jgi:hypothetical protein